MNIKTILSYLIIMVFLWLFFSCSPQKDISLQNMISSLKEEGVEILNLKKLEKYPGPVLTGEQGVIFSAKLDDCNEFNVMIVSYKDKKEALISKETVTELNDKTDGEFGYAFNRGNLFLMVGSNDIKCVSLFSKIFQSI